ncbi:MAG: RNA polymerase factor sigma-54 [Muribaculaceae bacterium]|nr:RNA polymerase factor sigma-54 [Muribaculaceae bacterium]
MAASKESLGLHLGQRQQQTLTPMQLQFVRVLEMNAPEVEDEVQRALDDNPALEAVPDDDAADRERESFSESAEEMQMADYRNEDDIPSYRLEASNHSAADRYYEPVAVDHGESLMDYLASQISELNLDDTDRRVALYIAGNIDDNGYMTRSLDAIADDLAFQVGLDVDEEHVRKVWNKIRTLDPAGVGAVDLRDCLLLQLKRRGDNGPDTTLAREIVEHYFDLFSRMHYDRLENALGAGHEAFRRAVELIKTLNPKPGALITGGAEDDRTRHITPDFAVDADDNGNVTVTLLNRLPQLQIERTFAADGGSNLPGGDSRAIADASLFIKQKRDEANTFIKVIALRQQTLFRVMSAIARIQHDFFVTEDEQDLRPMILKDVAAITGDDLSVISRATAGKYVAARQGVYPLKFFFNERPKDSTDVSSYEILGALRRIIDAEDKKNPLADADIAEKLQQAGYDIARRTVAKYRERLCIPVGRLRKRL